MVAENKTGGFGPLPSEYDAVLDTIGGAYKQQFLSALKYYNGSVYICCVSPHVDMLGGFLGELIFSSLYRYKVIPNRLFGGRGFYYSSTEVGGAALSEMKTLVEQGAVRAQIDAVYTLDEIADAHKHIQANRKNVALSIS